MNVVSRTSTRKLTQQVAASEDGGTDHIHVFGFSVCPTARFEQIWRKYERGVGAIQGVALRFKVHPQWCERPPGSERGQEPKKALAGSGALTSGMI